MQRKSVLSAIESVGTPRLALLELSGISMGV